MKVPLDDILRADRASYRGVGAEHILYNYLEPFKAYKSTLRAV